MAGKKRKKKKKKAEAPVLKTRAEMTESEYNELAAKAADMLCEHLGEESRSMSEESRDMLSGIVSEEFRRRMATDEVFFDKLNRFVSSRDFKDTVKRAEFSDSVMRDIYSKGQIKEKLAERYPDEYRLPENRTAEEEEKRPFMRRLRGRYR